MPASPLYHAVVLELERRRLASGLSMEQLDELAGTAERSYAKALYPDTESGRASRIEKLQLYVDVLFCEGFTLRMMPGGGMPTAIGTRRKIQAEAAHYDRPTSRRHMSELAKLAAAARRLKISPERRQDMARAAANARWGKRKVTLENYSPEMVD